VGSPTQKEGLPLSAAGDSPQCHSRGRDVPLSGRVKPELLSIERERSRTNHTAYEPAKFPPGISSARGGLRSASHRGAKLEVRIAAFQRQCSSTAHARLAGAKIETPPPSSGDVHRAPPSPEDLSTDLMLA